MLNIFTAVTDLNKQILHFHLLNKIVWFVVCVIVLTAVMALLRAASAQHLLQVQQVAAQSQLPKSQLLAQSTLKQSPIRMINYLRVMQAVQFERAQLQIYPAIETQPQPSSQN